MCISKLKTVTCFRRKLSVTTQKMNLANENCILQKQAMDPLLCP